jgi:hypothetical protein
LKFGPKKGPYVFVFGQRHHWSEPLLPLYRQKPEIEANRVFQRSDNLSFLQTQPIPQIRIALSRLVIPDPYDQGFFGTHHDHQFLSPGNRRINQIALQEDIMLEQNRDNHRRVFGALRFVDGNGVGQDNLIQIGVQNTYTIKTLRQCRDMPNSG